MFSGGVVETSGKAPSWGRPALRAGNRNSLARLRRTAASFDLRCRFVKGGVPPFHTFPPVMRAPNLRFAAILFFRLLGGNGWSAGLRPASRGSAKPAPTTLAPPISRWSAGLRPASRGSAKPAPTTLAPPISRWSAGLRPASRGSAKPAPTTPRPANLTVERRPPDRHRAGARNQHRRRWPRQSHGGAPVSDRHRAGARNPHRQRWPRQSHGGAPVSDRHRAGARNPHRRRWPRQSHGGAPVSDRHRAGARNQRRRRWPRQSHGGAPVSDRHRAGARNPHRQRWPRQSHGGAPVSDRHRAGARNPHRQRRAPPISRWSAGLPTGIARERETCTDNAGHANLTARSAGL